MQFPLVVSLFLGVVWVRLTEGCSCNPSHPQIQYCQADYVIRGKIVGKETIYPEKAQTTTTAAPTESPDVALAPWLNDSLSAARRGPPGLIEFSPFSNLADPNNPSKLVYTVYIEKIYKGDEFLTPKQLVKLTTPPNEALCGVTHLEPRQRYILSGAIWDGELSINLCDYRTVYSLVTKRQKQGLKYHWKKTCGECDVGVCFRHYCPTHKIPNRCMLDIAPTNLSCETDFARCVRNKNDDCAWYGKKDFRQCQKQRARDISSSLPFLP